MNVSRSPRDGLKRLTVFTLASSFACVVAAHVMLIGYKTYANVDEGYACALASRLLDGKLLYRGAVSQRGPLMYYSFEALGALFGWDNIVALRVVALLFALAHVYLVYWAGRKLLSKPAAIVATLVVSYALSFGLPPEDSIALNGESLQLPALVVGAVLGALAMRHRPLSRARLVRLAGAGLIFGIAASIKHSIAIHPAAVVLWLLIDAHRRRSPVRTVWIETAVLGACVLVVPAIFVAHAAAQGTLGDLYYYTVVYNRDVHMRPTPRHLKWVSWLFFRLLDQTTFPIVTTLLVGRAMPWVARRVRRMFGARDPWGLVRGFGVRHYVAAHFVIAVFSATIMWRFFPHYFIQAMPFFALGVGIAVEPALRGRFARQARAMTWAFGIFMIFAAAILCDFDERADGQVAHDETLKTMARVITATTKPDDRIFVWGFSPWIYGYSHRKPAGRYVFETYVTGFVPWYWEKLDLERSRIVPGSQEALLSDLEREHPAVVVDAGSIMMARPMRMFARFNDFLHAHYCFDMRIGALDLYRRKTGDAPCATAFPRPAHAFDFRGRAMPIPIPMTVDWEQSEWLPQGPFFKPLYFLNAPKPIGLDAARDEKRDKEEAEGAKEGFYVDKIHP